MTHPFVRPLRLVVFACAIGATSLVGGGVAGRSAEQASRTAPVGVIPGAPAGSPDQAPDSSGFNYASLFHEMKPDDTQGFRQIFDGNTLAGWDGDPTYWRAENGSIVGESTAQKRVAQNTFLIWRGERLRDFELKIDFRLNGTNSGVQLRSVELPDVGKWVLKGYQSDMDFINGFTGNLHEERGRDLLVPRGEVVRAVSGGFRSLGRIADSTSLRGMVNVNNWNRYHIIARGPMLLQLLNGQLMAVLIDEDAANRALEGVLGLQMHVGDPFRVEFRNVWFKRLQ
ncbi:MAG: DUF1080 domain-containing protein [Acidobacteriota bacterium]